MILLEDEAHPHGAEWNGRRAASFGLASSFSFQNGKVMTTGEGGIVVSNDEDFAARIRSLMNQGRCPGYSFFHHFEIGNLCRMSALHAGVLTAQLELMDEQIERRRRNWEVLLEALGLVPGLTWQQIPAEVESELVVSALGADWRSGVRPIAGCILCTAACYAILSAYALSEPDVRGWPAASRSALPQC